MTRLTSLTIALLCVPVGFALGAGPPAYGIRFAFASEVEGARILGTRDDFVVRMSPFDRASRMKTDQAVSVKAYLRFAAENALPWEAHEKQMVEAAFASIAPRLAELSVRFPKPIHLVKTTGNEEGETAYTRGAAIVIPRARLASAADLPELVSHELFHILLRHDGALRERLYRLIGFEKCKAFELPAALARRKITNPDTPRSDYRIRVRFGGDTVWAVPVLYSKSDDYDPARGGVFFDYLEFRLLLVEETKEGRCRPLYDGAEPRLVELREVAGFLEQVGRNTEYVIHPEEILADNFALLVLGATDLASPEIPNGIRDIFGARATGVPGRAG